MSIGFEGSVDLREFKEDMRKLPVIFQSAAVTGLNRVGRTTMSLITKHVRKRYNVTSKRMRNSHRLYKARRDRLLVKIVTDDKRISLSSFKARQTRTSKGVSVREFVSKQGGLAAKRSKRSGGRGVTVEVIKGARKRVKGAWLATGRGAGFGTGGRNRRGSGRGGVQVFSRLGKARHPLERHVGPSPAGMTRNPEVQAILAKAVPERLRDTVRDEIGRKIKRELRR